LLRRVGLDAPIADQYPHQLSGGMRQRALIAMAIACGPAIVVADEPTSALDPVVQAEIVALLRSLQRERGIALLVATHDLAFAAQLCDRLAVLYAGRIVEHAGATELLAHPRHPYTAGLLRSLPPPFGAGKDAPLEPIAGSPPRPWALPSGCRFRDRCPRAQEDCAASDPELVGVGGRQVACFHPLEAS
jgi:oligopeptide/dipeptide ABC transporter ATP-binding protein